MPISYIIRSESLEKALSELASVFQQEAIRASQSALHEIAVRKADTLKREAYIWRRAAEYVENLTIIIEPPEEEPEEPAEPEEAPL